MELVNSNNNNKIQRTWLLEDGTGENQYEGATAGQDSNYVLFILEVFLLYKIFYSLYNKGQ